MPISWVKAIIEIMGSPILAGKFLLANYDLSYKEARELIKKATERKDGC